MKKYNHSRKALFLLSLLMLFGFTAYSQNGNKLITEIKNANKNFINAFNTQDADAISMAYTKEARIFPSNSEVVSGREAIKGFWGNVMGMGIAKVELNTLNAERCGKKAIEEGSYTLFDSNNSEIDHGKYLVVWEKEQGEWKLSRDIWNTSMPATK